MFEVVTVDEWVVTVDEWIQTSKLELVTSKLELITSRLELITSRLELVKSLFPTPCPPKRRRKKTAPSVSFGAVFLRLGLVVSDVGEDQWLDHCASVITTIRGGDARG